MSMPSGFLAECKEYMRVDGRTEDALILGLIGAAVEYFASAGIPEPDPWSDRYKLIVEAETLHLYDHRDDIAADKSMPLGIRPFINQLKADAFCQAAAEDAT